MTQIARSAVKKKTRTRESLKHAPNNVRQQDNFSFQEKPPNCWHYGTPLVASLLIFVLVLSPVGG
jgi:hypothetical protein